MLGEFNWLPLPETAAAESGRARRARDHFRLALCDRPRARRGIARAHRFLAVLRGGRPLPAARAQHDRRDHAARAPRRGAVRVAGGRAAVRRQGRRIARAWLVRPRSCRGPSGLSVCARKCRVAGRSPVGRIPRPPRSSGLAALQRAIRLGRDALPSARRGGGRSGQGRGARGRRGDARRHRAQGTGAGARRRPRGIRACQRRQDALPRHHEPRIAHAAQRHHRFLRNVGERRPRCASTPSGAATTPG